jgi:transposase
MSPWNGMSAMRRGFQDYRLPSGRQERQDLAEMIGQDGRRLFALLDETPELAWVRHVPAVETLRRVWVQQFYADEHTAHWREAKDLPASSLLICTPYDPDARYRTKRSTTWTGYKVHLTESCDDEAPHLITDVQTTPAPRCDWDMTLPIERSLETHHLLPTELLLDQGYVTADHLLSSQDAYQVDLVGPIATNPSWQTRSQAGFGAADFEIHWEDAYAICPQGCRSVQWYANKNSHDQDTIQIRFAATDCTPCPVRSWCTQAATLPRTVRVRSQQVCDAQEQARTRQHTPEFKAVYAKRAGIEGTLSQGVRAFGLRRSRYIGEAKTHLQHLMIACALNLARVFAWSQGQLLEPTRRSRFAALAPASLAVASK